MKTTFASIWISLVVLAATSAAVLAQDDNSYGNDNTTYEAPEATTVVYEAPVTYYAPVLYQAPVVYYGPVYYVSAPPMDGYEPPSGESATASSTVFVIGAHGGSYGYSNHENSCSAVITFGQSGGWFGSWW